MTTPTGPGHPGQEPPRTGSDQNETVAVPPSTPPGATGNETVAVPPSTPPGATGNETVAVPPTPPPGRTGNETVAVPPTPGLGFSPPSPPPGTFPPPGQFGQPQQTGQLGQPQQGGYPAPGQPQQPGQFGQPRQGGYPAPGQPGPTGQPQQTGQFGQPQQTGDPRQWGQGQPGHQPAMTQPSGGGRPGGGQRTTLLAGMAAGVVVLIVVGAVIWLSRGGDEPGPGEEAVATTTSAPTTSTTEASRIGTAVGGADLQAGDCLSFDVNAVSIATFDLVACDGPHTAEVTGLLEHPQAAQRFPGADELTRFGDGCAAVTESYLGVDVYRTTLTPNLVVPEQADWDDGMYWVACTVLRYDLADLDRSAAGQAETLFPRGTQVSVGQLAAGDCFGPVTAGAEMSSVGPDDLVDLLPCDDHHPAYFFGRAALHDWSFGEPWPGTEAVDAVADAACDLEFTRHFGVDSDLGFKYRFWRPTEETWATGQRAALCMVADDRGVPPTLDFSSWQPVIELAVGTCYIFPPDTDYTTLDGGLYVGAVPCEAFHHGEMFGSGDLPEGPFPADVATDTNVACEEHFVDYIGRGSADSYYAAYVFWSPLAEEWDLPGGRHYACSLLYEAPLQGSARGSNI